jgi:hypothetical protein
VISSGEKIALKRGDDEVKALIKLVLLTITIMICSGVAQARAASMIADQTEALFPKGSVLSPVVESNATQHIFLIVRDQDLNPVQGAASLLTVQFKREVQSWLMPLTDEFGVSQLVLEVENQPPGSYVLLEFQVIYEELEASTRDSFRIWW